jgi:hypothetical protein
MWKDDLYIIAIGIDYFLILMILLAIRLAHHNTRISVISLAIIFGQCHQRLITICAIFYLFLGCSN